MSKLRALLVASALLTAACGGAATHSSSNAQPASFAGVQVNAGPNADSDMSDITNRPNPPVNKGGSTPTNPPATTTKSAAPAASQPSMGSGFDRCNTGTGSSTGLSPRAPGAPGKQPPLPECAVE